MIDVTFEERLATAAGATDVMKRLLMDSVAERLPGVPAAMVNVLIDSATDEQMAGAMAASHVVRIRKQPCDFQSRSTEPVMRWLRRRYHIEDGAFTPSSELNAALAAAFRWPPRTNALARVIGDEFDGNVWNKQVKIDGKVVRGWFNLAAKEKDDA